ncbi:SPW repeat protein [Streptomyces sp. DH12]|uniref:SPW repeat domain-containing protein n=1 Tax=Streptomyces sp. DH12 TaxID=2857010 RepID=UPI001E5D3917|nr:SPW repeat protein [Streptomyces sp. DH12]
MEHKATTTVAATSARTPTSSAGGRQPTPEAARRILREGQRDQIISLLMGLVAIALFVAPWVAGEPDTAKDAHRNELAVGMVVVFTAMARLRWHLGRRADLLTLAAGAWLVGSPWLLGLQDTVVFADGAHVFDVAAGTVLIVLSAVSFVLYRPAVADDPKPEHRQERSDD